jgi:hypothetical protein
LRLPALEWLDAGEVEGSLQIPPGYLADFFRGCIEGEGHVPIRIFGMIY